MNGIRLTNAQIANMKQRYIKYHMVNYVHMTIDINGYTEYADYIYRSKIANMKIALYT